MKTKTTIPNVIMAGLVLAIVLDTMVQISWKFAVSGIPENASVAATALGALSSVFFYLALLGFAAQYFNWMQVLARADLSFAQPITALSYVIVVAIAGHSLHEKISLTKVFGMALILWGVYFISRTPYKTIRHPHSS